jgi:hypothetical protein
MTHEINIAMKKIIPSKKSRKPWDFLEIPASSISLSESLKIPLIGIWNLLL